MGETYSVPQVWRGAHNGLPLPEPKKGAWPRVSPSPLMDQLSVACQCGPDKRQQPTVGEMHARTELCEG